MCLGTYRDGISPQRAGRKTQIRGISNERSCSNSIVSCCHRIECTKCLLMGSSRLQDYISAASYFRQLSSFYYNNDWTRLEVPMLDLYAKCLKHINRWEDFCRIGLQIVAKTTSRPTLPPTSTELQFQNGPYNVDHYLQEVINISRSLERPVSTPLHLHFEGVHLDPYIRHVDEEDGFRMSLQVRNIMSAAVEVQGIRVQLVSIEEEQRRDIWITNQGPDLLQTGLSVIILQSTVCRVLKSSE